MFLREVVSSLWIPVCIQNSSHQMLGICRNCWKLTYPEHSKSCHFRHRMLRTLRGCGLDAPRCEPNIFADVGWYLNTEENVFCRLRQASSAGAAKIGSPSRSTALSHALVHTGSAGCPRLGLGIGKPSGRSRVVVVILSLTKYRYSHC